MDPKNDYLPKKIRTVLKSLHLVENAPNEIATVFEAYVNAMRQLAYEEINSEIGDIKQKVSIKLLYCEQIIKRLGILLHFLGNYLLLKRIHCSPKFEKCMNSLIVYPT